MLKESVLFNGSWNVAWRKAAPGTLLQDRITPFTVVKNSFRYWAADPFLLEYRGKTYIFAELYDYIRRRGVIGYCTLDGGKTSKWRPVIIEAHHLSFPNVYTEGDEVYLLPESYAAGELAVYKAVHFPDQWEKCRVLRTGVRYVDTVFLKDDALHQKALTYDIQSPDGPELVILDLEKEAKDQRIPCPDPQMRRPAGKVLTDQRLRPAQNCTGGYGKGIIFYRYNFSGGSTYQEKEAVRMFPQDVRLSKKLYLDGMHTYNCSEHYEVIDIATRHFNLLNFAGRIVGKILRL